MRRFGPLLFCVIFAFLFLAAVPLPAPASDGLRISEVMVKNKASLPDEHGVFSDWIELENAGTEPVDLSGWSLSDRAGVQLLFLSPRILQPGEFTVVFCSGDSFSLSEGETLFLFSPDAQTVDSLFCSDGTSDRSLARQEDGSFRSTDWISPGWPNTAAGYESFCSLRTHPEPLCITEVVVRNPDKQLYWSDEDFYDWVEIRNVSDEAVQLEGYMLSDDAGLPDRWIFPELSVAPGECIVILCSEDRVQEEWMAPALTASFSLDSQRDQLYLRNPDGVLLDYVALHGIPAGGSMGREKGREGFLYYSLTTPFAENSGGKRRVSEAPAVLEGDGVFNGRESVTVRFGAPGEIRYEFGGPVPTGYSPLYIEPLALTQTGVVRARAWEDDALPSDPATCTVILNEGHSLPVLSLAIGDVWGFQSAYNEQDREPEFAANLALYDGERVFSRLCGVGLRGWSSLTLPKKSLGVVFRGCYGGDLEANLFDNGITSFHSLSIRGGQDYPFSIFRNELCQDLCLEASPYVLSQASRFCVLYLNGEYWGIYCLKEDISRSYYASHAGVSKTSVTNLRGPVPIDTDLYREVIEFSWMNDLREEENYRHICERMDMDSLVDWFLLESWSNNNDIQGNVRYMRSPENGNRWQMVFYDLDWTLGLGVPFSALMAGEAHTGEQMYMLIRYLALNPDFRARALERYSEMIRGPLSDEHVLSMIDGYVALLASEVPRDHERWGQALNEWEYNVDQLRSRIADSWADYTVYWLCYYLSVDEAERAQYFGF